MHQLICYPVVAEANPLFLFVIHLPQNKIIPQKPVEDNRNIIENK